MLAKTGTLAKMAALVVLLATVLCAAVTLGGGCDPGALHAGCSRHDEQHDARLRRAARHGGPRSSAHPGDRGAPQLIPTPPPPYVQQAVPVSIRPLEETTDGMRPSQEEVDGVPASRDQFRHHAYIDLDERWMCSGSLIKPTAVLTKGACVDGFRKFTIRLGTIIREAPDDSAYTVESIWGLVHPEYDLGKYYTNDIAVIQLKVEVPLGKSIWPVMLPTFDEVNNTFTGERAQITGWGRIDEPGYDKLRYANVTVISNDLCKKFFKRGYIIDTTLCAGNAYCLGDHGGALVIKTGENYTQIGIASFLTTECEVPTPGAYARVTSYLEWIERAAGKLHHRGAAIETGLHFLHEKANKNQEVNGEPLIRPS